MYNLHRLHSLGSICTIWSLWGHRQFLTWMLSSSYRVPIYLLGIEWQPLGRQKALVSDIDSCSARLHLSPLTASMGSLTDVSFIKEFPIYQMVISVNPLGCLFLFIPRWWWGFDSHICIHIEDSHSRSVSSPTHRNWKKKGEWRKK